MSAKTILQIYVGPGFDQAQAKALALAAGYEGGRGKKLSDHPGNMSGLVADLLGLPVEAGPELKRLIQKYCPHPEVDELGEQENGYPGGDVVKLRCRRCGATWKEELPQ